MKIIKAILLGVLLYVLIFLEISIVKIILNIQGLLQYIIHYIFLIPIASLCTWIYYRNSPEKTNGLLLGFFFLIVASILDLLITVPFFIKSYSGFYSDIYLWIGFVELILVVWVYDLYQN